MGHLCAVLAICLCVCGVLGGSNQEVARRTIDNMQGFLAKGDFALGQIADAVSLGFMPTDTQFFEYCRNLVYAQLMTTEDIAAVYVYVRGELVGVSRENNLLMTTQAFFGASCDNALNMMTGRSNQSLCIHSYVMDSAGTPTTFVASIMSNSIFDNVPGNDTTIWLPVMEISLGSLGIGKSMPLHDENGVNIGFATVAVSLAKLSNFLVSAFGQESDARVVYIAERETDDLVATSNGAVVEAGSLYRINAFRSPVALIRESIAAIHELGYDKDMFISFVSNGYEIEATVYEDVGMAWHVIVVRPVDITEDLISTKSETFYVLAVAASLSMTLSMFLMIWVIRYGKLRLWKTAQPPLLLSILIANLVGASCAFVLSGAPSKSRCLARQWMVVLAVTLTCGAFLAKLLRVYFCTRTTHLFNRDNLVIVKARHVVMLVSALVLIQIFLLSLWTGLDPMQPKFVYTIEQGVASGVEVCHSESSWGMIACASFVAILIFGGSYLAYVNRDVSESLSESRAMMMTFYHGVFISAVLLIVGLFANVSNKSFLLFLVLGLIWFSSTTQAALFLPRVYRQITLGDLTQWEVKEMVVHHLNKQQTQDTTRASFAPSRPVPATPVVLMRSEASYASPPPRQETLQLPIEEMYVI